MDKTSFVVSASDDEDDKKNLAEIMFNNLVKEIEMAESRAVPCQTSDQQSPVGSRLKDEFFETVPNATDHAQSEIADANAEEEVNFFSTCCNKLNVVRQMFDSFGQEREIAVQSFTTFVSRQRQLEMHFKELDANRNRLLSAYREKEQAIATLEAEKAKNEADIEKLTSELNLCRAQVNQDKKRNKELAVVKLALKKAENKCKQLEGEKGSLMHNLTTVKKENKKLEAKLKQNKNLKSKLEDNTIELKSIQKRATGLEAQVQQQEHQLNEKVEEIKSLNQDLKLRKVAFNKQLKQQLNKIVRTKDDEIKVKSDSLTKLQSELKLLQNKVSEQQKTNDDLLLVNHSKRIQVAKMTQSLANLKIERDRKSEENNQLKRDCTLTESKFEQLEISLTSKNEEVESFQKILAQRNADVERLNSRIEQFQKRLREKSAEIEKLERKSKILIGTINENTKEINQLNEIATSRNYEFNNLQQKVLSMNETLNRVDSEECGKFEERIKWYQDKLLKSNGTISLLKQKLKANNSIAADVSAVESKAEDEKIGELNFIVDSERKRSVFNEQCVKTNVKSNASYSYIDMKTFEEVQQKKDHEIAMLQEQLNATLEENVNIHTENERLLKSFYNHNKMPVKRFKIQRGNDLRIRLENRRLSASGPCNISNMNNSSERKRRALLDTPYEAD